MSADQPATRRRTVGVSEFKAEVNRFVEEAQETGQEYVVTKWGKPMVLVTPILQKRRSAFGTWRGEERGDIVNADWSELFRASRGKAR